MISMKVTKKDGTVVKVPVGFVKKNYVLTEEDRAAIVLSVIESLGGNPISGYVDENNNIIVKGNLNSGSYNVKYEQEDGTTVDIGQVEIGGSDE